MDFEYVPFNNSSTFSSGQLSVLFRPVLPSSEREARPGGGEGWSLAPVSTSVRAGVEPEEERWDTDEFVTVVHRNITSTSRENLTLNLTYGGKKDNIDVRRLFKLTLFRQPELLQQHVEPVVGQSCAGYHEVRVQCGNLYGLASIKPQEETAGLIKAGDVPFQPLHHNWLINTSTKILPLVFKPLQHMKNKYPNIKWEELFSSNRVKKGNMNS